MDSIKSLFVLLTLVLSGCGSGGGAGGNDITLSSIAITPASATVTSGLDTNFMATATYSDGSTSDITSQVAWSTADNSIATISSSGVASGLIAGVTTVTSSMSGITSPSASLTVDNGVPVSISISPTTVSTPQGQTVTYIATATYANASTGNVSGSVTWASSNNSVAGINSTGLATTLSVGSTNITASSNLVTSNTAVLAVTPSIQMGGARQGTDLNLNQEVTTLAGSNIAGAVDGTGIAASFNRPGGITTDGTDLYVVDTDNNLVRKINIATGIVITLAGSGTPGATDGTGIAATFNEPNGITTDGTNLYVAERSNHKIRKIVIATGEVTTFAGTGTPGAIDATGTAASFYWPNGLTTDGTNLYVADSGNNKIRKIVIATGEVTTIAGSGVSGWGDAGVGTNALFFGPWGITTDGSYLYVSDYGNNMVRRIYIGTGSAYTVQTIAGTVSPGSADGTGTLAAFDHPVGITTDGTNLYVADSWGNKIRKIVINDVGIGVVTTLAGSGNFIGDSQDGTGTAATFYRPRGITTDGINLYVAESIHKIRKIQ